MRYAGSSVKDRRLSSLQSSGGRAAWLAAPALAGILTGLLTGVVLAKANEAEWAEPQPADALMARFATVTIEIEQVIGTATADASAGTVQLEIFLPHDGLVPELRATAPRERAVFFLRTKADAPEFFRLVNDNQGLIRELAGTSHAMGATEGTFLAEIDGRPFEEMLAQLRSIVP